MIVGIFASAANSTHYIEIMKQFYRGVTLHSPCFLEHTDIYRSCDYAVIFGSYREGKKKQPTQALKKHIIDNHTGSIIWIESCLLGRVAKVSANKHWRVGMDGFMLDGKFGFFNNPPADRWNELGIDLKPWKIGGDYILIGLQTMGDASLFGSNHFNWLTETVTNICKITDMPIRIRPHPLMKPTHHAIFNKLDILKHPRVTVSRDNTLAEDLKDANCMVTYTSGSGIDSVINGVPHIALHKYSMAAPVSGDKLTDMLNLPTPPREKHFYNLAYAQWTPEEMESGKCWKHILDNVIGNQQ